MDTFFKELSRRKVISALFIYAMVAWVVLQVASVVADPLLFPDWVERALVIAAILGFPVIAMLSWVFDLTRAGLVQTEEAESDQRRPLGYISISLAILMLIGVSGFIAVQLENTIAPTTIQTAPTSDKIVSLAILPFDGSPNASEPHLLRMSEEISVRLGKNPKIRLATDNAISALPANMQREQIASQLGVEYLIGGNISELNESIQLSIWLFKSTAQVWQRDFKHAQIYVVNELIVNELLIYFNLQEDRRGLLTDNANAYDLYLRGLQSAISNDEKSEAIDLFEQAIAEDPKFPLPHAELCSYQVTRYRELKSIEAFELAERFCFRALSLDDGSLEVHEAMGYIYLSSGKLEKARDSFNAALAINTQHFASKLGLARSYLSDDPVYAESILSELAIEQPGDPSVYSTLQFLYFSLGRYGDAVQPAQLALRLNPSSDSAKLNLSANLLLAGNFSESKTLLLEMLQTNSPRSGSIKSNLATVYFFEGDFADAAQLYQEALNKEPENALYARNLADAVWHNEGSEPALVMFKNVIELSKKHLQINPNNAEVLSCIMVAYASLGNLEDFKTSLNSLLRISGEDPQAYYDAAVAYARLGDRALSSQNALKAKDLGYPPALIFADPDIKL